MNIVNTAFIIVTIVVSLISKSYSQYGGNFHINRYKHYGGHYNAYRGRYVPRKSYGRGYQQSYGELQVKPIIYPNRHHKLPSEDYPIEAPIPISPDLEPDYNWYKENEYKQLFKSYPKKYGNYFEGMTFYSKSKPIYVEKKPIIKIIKQPVYIKQPIVIKKQPVIHKEEVVTINKKPPIVTEIKVPEVELKPSIDEKITHEKKPIEAKNIEKTEKDIKQEIDKPKEQLKPEISSNDKDEKSISKEQIDEKKPLPELEDP